MEHLEPSPFLFPSPFHFVQRPLYFFSQKNKFTRVLLYLLFYLLYFCRLERLVGVLRKRISDSGGASVATINQREDWGQGEGVILEGWGEERWTINRCILIIPGTQGKGCDQWTPDYQMVGVYNQVPLQRDQIIYVFGKVPPKGKG